MSGEACAESAPFVTSNGELHHSMQTLVPACMESDEPGVRTGCHSLPKSDGASIAFNRDSALR